MVRRTLMTLGIVVWAASAHAQTPALPDQAEVLVFLAGSDTMTAAPIASRITAISPTTNCGIASLPAPGPTPLINPTKAYFDDPFTTGRFCMADMPTGLPSGTGYVAAMRAIAATCLVNNSTVSPCPSPRSAQGIPAFNIQPPIPPPITPTNLTLRP